MTTIWVAAKQPQGRVGHFLIDEADAGIVAKFDHWYMTAAGYPYALEASARRYVWLAPLLLGKVPGKVVDHRNRTPYDNRRENLRHVTHCGNAANVGVRRHSRSGIKGVRWHSQSGLWQAKIQVLGRQIGLGYFHEQRDASATFIVAHRYYHEELYPGFRLLLRVLFGTEELSWSGRAVRRLRGQNGRFAMEAQV